jgi:hypothetical protein
LVVARLSCPSRKSCPGGTIATNELS